MNSILCKRYSIDNIIGKGKFGVVFKGKNIKSGELVAIKMEDKRTPAKLLKHEASLLKYLHDHDCRNTPIVYWYGLHEENTCVVMPFYESSLFDKIVSYDGEAIPIEKINKIMCVCIDIVESIHKNYVIHRDIKPQNFMYRNGELYLIDFGLSTFYIDENKDHNIILEGNEHITGTPKYISYFIHQGISPSRKDDLISLGYMYIWLITRELPWDIVNTSHKEDSDYDESHILHWKNQERKRLKALDTLDVICGRINQSISKYLNYSYGLDYKHTPNYEGLYNLFSSS